VRIVKEGWGKRRAFSRVEKCFYGGAFLRMFTKNNVSGDFLPKLYANVKDAKGLSVWKL